MINSAKNTPLKIPSSKKGLPGLIFLVSLMGLIAVYLIAERQGLFPQMAQTQTSSVWEDKTQIEQRLQALSNQINVLKTDIASKLSDQSLKDFEERVTNTAQMNKELLDSKASTAALLALVTRIDSLEAQMREVGKFSSQGALVLTAALMVKESADEGRPFVYEAEVLSLLADGTNMQTAAVTMAQYAHKGLPSIQALIVSFNEIYEKEARGQDEQSAQKTEGEGWKEKLSAGLNKLITIESNAQKKVDGKTTTDEVFKLVNDGRLDEALEKMKQNPKYATKDFLAWQESFQMRRNFMTALQNIKSLTLAQMKAESLKALSD